MTPKTTSQWRITPNSGIVGLQIKDKVQIPELKGRQCLVQIDAVSLNYRDIALAWGRYPLPITDSFVPCSDSAGQIVAIGSQVTEFQVGDKVCTLFMQDHQDGIVTPKIRESTLGSQRDGVLQQYAIFEETGLVSLPNHLSCVEGFTLPCAAVMAWNCLFGLELKALRKGDFLLTQGTGGVSLFAIQIALAIGATIISTTSTTEKEHKLRQLGTHHVINYKSHPTGERERLH
jgi:NADPH:quinone reductase-like Zn-dependent oxidoreductase